MMKHKQRFGAVELLGLLGLAIWGTVVLLRGGRVPPPGAARALLGALPNVGAAWAATLCGKCVWVHVCGKPYTWRCHVMFCAGVAGLALASECVYHLFFSSPFDPWDMLATVGAQALMLCLPMRALRAHDKR